MSRIARTRARPNVSEPTRRPILVWIVYALGVLAVLVLVASALFAAARSFGSDDTTVNISPLAVVVWGGLVVLAVATWLWRLRKGRR